MRAPLALGALLLTGCDPHTIRQPQKVSYAVDGYYYETKPYEQRNLSVTMVLHSSLKDLQNSFVKEYPNDLSDVSTLRAYTVNYKYYHGSCTIHIVDPAVSYQPQYIGHELMHCMNGDWHSTQVSK